MHKYMDLRVRTNKYIVHTISMLNVNKMTNNKYSCLPILSTVNCDLVKHLVNEVSKSTCRGSISNDKSEDT